MAIVLASIPVVVERTPVAPRAVLEASVVVDHVHPFATAIVVPFQTPVVIVHNVVIVF